MKKWKIVLCLFLIFTLGMGAGGLLTLKIAGHRIRKTFQQGPDGLRPWILKRLQSKLHLDSAQKDQVDSILREGQRDGRDLIREFKPRLVQLIENSERKIHDILRDDQQTEFDEMVRQRKERLDRIFPDPAPPATN